MNFSFIYYLLLLSRGFLFIYFSRFVKSILLSLGLSKSVQYEKTDEERHAAHRSLSSHRDQQIPSDSIHQNVHQPYSVSPSGQSDHERYEARFLFDNKKPRFDESPGYDGWHHEDEKHHSKGKYVPRHPLSPHEGVEAKEGMLPPSSHYASMPAPSQTSPRFITTSPRHNSSSSSLQSLKSNVDNISKLFQEASGGEHRSDGMYYDGGTPFHPSVMLKCNICSDVFYEDSKFKQHMFMHDQVSLLKQDPPKLLKPGTYECKFCRVLFDDKNKLKLHYSEQHEKEFVYTQPMDQLYQCSLCEQTFVDYSKLVQHHLSHQQGRREVFILPKKQKHDALHQQIAGTILSLFHNLT